MVNRITCCLLFACLCCSGQQYRFGSQLRFSTGSSCATAYVNSKGLNWGNTAGLNETTPAMTVVAGDLLMIAVGWSAGVNSTLTNISASSGNTMTLIDSKTNTSNGQLNTYYIKNASAGSTTIAAKWNADPTFGFMTIIEASGLNTTTPLDQHSIATVSATGSGLPVNSTTVTTGSSCEFVYAAAFDQGASATMGGNTGFTLQPSTVATFGCSIYQLQTSAGAVTPSFTQTAFDTFILANATFKP